MGRSGLPELRDTENHTFASLQGEYRHLSGVARGVDYLCSFGTLRLLERKELKEKEWRQDVDGVEENVLVL